MEASGGRQQAVRPSNKQERQLADRQVGTARHIPEIGNRHTPAPRDKGTEGVVEAGRHLEGQMTIGRERPIQAERQTGWMDRPGNSRGTGTGLGRARPL